MKNYGAVSPNFWTGETGKKIRKMGVEAQLVALYLLTNKHRNALGIYYLPKILISHETALTSKGASKGLQSLSEAGFCTYDPPSEVVWVFEMARFQIGESLSEKDNRVKWINEKYDNLPKNPFLKPFYNKYQDAFHLKNGRSYKGPSKPLESPSEPPSKPDTDSDTDTDKKNTRPDGREQEDFYTTKKGRKLEGSKLERFNKFWDTFDYKEGKAEAADAWMDIKDLNGTKFFRILKVAKYEAGRRQELRDKGKTPKMAQGWLTGKRWENEIPSDRQQENAGNEGPDWMKKEGLI